MDRCQLYHAFTSIPLSRSLSVFTLSISLLSPFRSLSPTFRHTHTQINTEIISLPPFPALSLPPPHSFYLYFSPPSLSLSSYLSLALCLSVISLCLISTLFNCLPVSLSYFSLNYVSAHLGKTTLPPCPAPLLRKLCGAVGVSDAVLPFVGDRKSVV